MFIKNSFINSVGEYAYDCMNRYDMLLRDEVCDDVIEITTQYESILLTPETLVATGRGFWKRADELYIGDTLKHYTMNTAVITGITSIHDLQYMLKIVDCTCGYLVVNGFYISAD